MNAFVASLLTVVVAASLARGAAAQNPDGERAQAEIQRTQRQLQHNRAEVDRLLELRLRHDLGLPADEADRTFRPPAPIGSESMDRMRMDLREEDAATSSLLEQYNKLRAQVEALKAEADARMASSEGGPSVVVPTAGSRLPAPAQGPGRAANDPPAAPLAQTQPAGEPVGVPAAGPQLPLMRPLDKPREWITGSKDHQLVAQALFKAGQQQMDDAARALELNQPEVARQFADRGRDSLKRGLDELAPLLKDKNPAFPALFYQGRCLELLFRYAERYEGLSITKNAADYQRREQEVRDAFLKITVRDVKKTGPRADIEELGPWGRAAQTAMVHFQWMNQHADYDVMQKIQALTWPGEKDQ